MVDLFAAIEAGEYLRTPPATLQWWRHIKRGPNYVKIGRRIFYRKSDLDDFIGENVCTPEVCDVLKTSGLCHDSGTR